MLTTIRPAAPCSVPVRQEGPTNFAFRLVHADGTPAHPPTPNVSVPNMHLATGIALGSGRSRVVEARPGAQPDGDSVLVVEPDVS
jgi:hypothetical protein